MNEPSSGHSARYARKRSYVIDQRRCPHNIPNFLLCKAHHIKSRGPWKSYGDATKAWDMQSEGHRLGNPFHRVRIRASFSHLDVSGGRNLNIPATALDKEVPTGKQA